MELFKKTRLLENKITTFLSNIDKSGYLFQLAFKNYFKSNISPEFLDLRSEVSHLEATNDSLRREIENQLYAQMIMPDMRSDILKLIEGCDKIINKYETDLILLSIEKTKIPKQLKDKIMTLIETNIHCVALLLGGIQAFFEGKNSSDFIREVSVLEHQVDLQAMELKQIVFQEMKLPLARQMQLKEFIYGIEKISDMSEDMADSLSVFAVKHAV